MPWTKRKPMAAAYRIHVDDKDIEACLAGKCKGQFCPCLCHTSLNLPHDRIPKPGARVDRRRG